MADPLVALLTAVLVSLGICACARSNIVAHPHTSSATETTLSTATSGSYLASDEDNDSDDVGNRSFDLTPTIHDSFIAAGEGKRADPAERLTVTALVKRYYTAAAAEDGGEACKLLYSTIASGLAEGQAQSTQRAGASCAAALSRLFKQQHPSLVADDVPTMSVIEVRVKGEFATATLGFRAVPVAGIRLEREAGIWRMDALLDSGQG